MLDRSVRRLYVIITAGYGKIEPGGFTVKLKNILPLTLLLAVVSHPLRAFEFRYTYNAGNQYRFLSTVNSASSFVGGEVVRREILNRLAYRVAETDGERGRLIGTIHTSERTPGETGASLWTTDYPADFWRDARGNYQVAPQYFMPMVRNVPLFPEGDIPVGHRWTAAGEEVHDISQLLGLKAPFHIPFNAQYQYLGPVQKEGKQYHKIHVQYSYAANFPKPFGRARLAHESYAVKIEGAYDQDIYWDESIGQPAWYEEHYASRITFSNGAVYTTEGNADAYLIEAIPMDKEQLKNEIKNRAAQLELGNIAVENAADGIKLILDNIRFKPNTAEFLHGEDTKLKKIGELLKLYPDRDIAIIGHTAKAGTAQESQSLSEQRALAVADFLIRNGYRTKERLMTQGKGSSEPVASNATAAGMAKNRRVEITILEN
jgi:outer membrane protein OmpA-like peptidoglycan-associated protein